MRRKINQKDTVFSKNSFLCGRGIRDIKVGFSLSLSFFGSPIQISGSNDRSSSSSSSAFIWGKEGRSIKLAVWKNEAAAFKSSGGGGVAITAFFSSERKTFRRVPNWHRSKLLLASYFFFLCPF